MGSVKDLIVIKEAGENNAGIGRFVFSDRYSVFDWGEMPDMIEDKGKSLCIMGSYFFEKMEEKGIKSHYIGVIEDGIPKRLGEVNNASNVMQIKLLRVIKPGIKGKKYDYSAYKKERRTYLIPLEIIYRNSIPPGSSIFRRLKNGELKPEDKGMNGMAQPGQKLKKRIIEASTKLEKMDRYIKWDEAKKIAGLDDDEVERIKELSLKINEIISSEVKKAGMENEDGKIEFGFDENREIIVVDVAGTPDECRFTYNGLPVSKEIAREFYRNTEWYKIVEEAKRNDIIKWRDMVRAEPPPLPPRLRELISLMYKASCNEITSRRWFDVPSLREIMKEIGEVIA